MPDPTTQATPALEPLRVIRRRLWLIVACALIVPAAAVAFSLSQEKQYEATSQLLFRDPAFDQKVFGSLYSVQGSDPDRDAATNQQLVNSDVVIDRVRKRLPEAGDIGAKVRVQAEGQSNLVTIQAVDSQPARAAEIANVFAREYIAFRRGADRSKLKEAQAVVSRQLAQLSEADRSDTPQGRSLSRRDKELAVLASLQTGGAELVQPADVPDSAASPNPLRNGVIGAFLGLLLGLGLAFGRERFDRRLREPGEFSLIFERPVLGGIPKSRALASAGPTSVGLPARESEAFQMLRANLRYFNLDRDVTSVLVTSASPGDGKSTVSFNLAAAAADTGARVLILEADLRHPVLAKGLGLGRADGLSNVLAGQAELAEVVQEIAIAQAKGTERPSRTIDVVLAGPPPPNPADMIESDRMREVLAEAERRYDFVVIDTPPTSTVSDAIPLLTEVSGVVVVSRIGKTTREQATHLHHQLQNLGAPVLGVVVNSVSSAVASPYAYGYAYAYGPRTGSNGNGDGAGARRMFQA